MKRFIRKVTSKLNFIRKKKPKAKPVWVSSVGKKRGISVKKRKISLFFKVFFKEVLKNKYIKIFLTVLFLCGFVIGIRYFIFSSRFNIKKVLKDLKPHYNIAPGYNFPIVFDGGGENKVELMKWGLVPFWADDPKIGYRMINARAETLSTKPSFRKPLKSQRCLVPANGFYEWKKENGKAPYFIKRKDNELFAMAGMYDVWQDAENKKLKTFTIVTVDANPMIRKIHDRMPAILEKEEEVVWLDGKSEISKALNILKPYQGRDMVTYRVSEKVNKPIHDEPELIKPEIG
jgi:putative SOS response-associated peptidase YedK